VAKEKLDLLAIGIRRVQGVKRLGRKSGNWLTRTRRSKFE
jgi:hypothetical protein